MELNAWENTQKQLKSFVVKRVKDKSLAEDIVQDVFIKVHSNLAQLKDTGKITGWIFQIARNAISDHFRTQSKTVSLHDLDWESDTRELNECVAECLQQMLTTLPHKYREALRMSEMENLSQLEVASRLDISYSGAKSRVQRARQMLKEKMDAHYLIKMDTYGNVTVCENRKPCGCSRKYAESCG